MRAIDILSHGLKSPAWRAPTKMFLSPVSRGVRVLSGCRRPGAPAVELLRQTAVGLLSTVEAPLAIATSHKPFVILTIGVNGTGKTTTVGKLAHRLKAQGYSVLLAAADTFRAAAVEQLQEWGERAHVPDPAAVVHDALVAARARRRCCALAQALKFHERLKLTGVAITKLDGTAKGGILFAIARQLKVPIRLVAVGESVADLDDFRAEEFVRALLGDAPR